MALSVTQASSSLLNLLRWLPLVWIHPVKGLLPLIGGQMRSICMFLFRISLSVCKVLTFTLQSRWRIRQQVFTLGHLKTPRWFANSFGSHFSRRWLSIPVSPIIQFLCSRAEVVCCRWCPTYPEHFAISTQSPNKGAILHVHNCNFVHAPPTSFVIRPKPHFIRDFDFLSLRGIPRIAAAIGRTLVVFSIGVDT